MPNVSVIIPVYNVEKYLRECLNSVVNQTLKDIEIICIDDGSTDESLKILNEYASKDNRFIILTQENSGSGAARNRGVKLATGEYVHFLDSDDFLDTNFYEVMYNTAINNFTDLVLCSWNIIKDDSRNLFPNNNLKIKSKVFFKNNNDYRQKINVEIWNKLFKKSIIDEYNITFPLFKYGEDASFTYQYLIHATNAYGLDEHLYNYRLSANGLMYDLIKDGTKITESIKSQRYTFLYIKNLPQNKYEPAILFFLQRLKSYIFYIIQVCPINKQKELLSKISKEILQNIPPKYIKDNVIKNIYNKQYDKAIKHLTKGMIDKTPIIKHFIDTQNLKIGKSHFNLNKTTGTENKINITLLLDDKYFHCTYIAITSLINSKSSKSALDLNIIVNNISMLQRRLLENFKAKGVNINIIEADMTKYADFHNVYHVTPTSLIKFDFANLLPNIDKTIYVDGDVLINKDLSELYNLDITNFYIAAVREYRAEQYKYNELLGTKYYINSGVMLLNLAKMRSDNISERFYQIKRTQPAAWQCQDQDIINYVCNEKIYILPPTYNSMIGIFIKQKYNINEINKFYQTNFKNLKDMYKKSAIIHYAGDLKPWGKGKNKLPQYIVNRYQYIGKHILINSRTNDYTILEKIFSIKNENTRKVITILGIKLKFKSQKLIERQFKQQVNKSIKNLKNEISEQNRYIRYLETQITTIQDSIGITPTQIQNTTTAQVGACSNSCF